MQTAVDEDSLSTAQKKKKRLKSTTGRFSGISFGCIIECLLDRLAGAPGQIGLVALSLSYGSAKMTQGQDSGFKFKFKFGPNRLFKFAARTGKLNALTRPC